MSTPVSHPLVGAYLRDLEMLLHGIEPGERAEVLAGVHEHLEVSLGPDASDADVRHTLAELGSPQSVADEAYAGRPPLPMPSLRRASPWTGMLAVGINAACIAFLVLIVSSSAAHASEVAFGAVVFLLPWVAVCVLSSMSNTWDGRQKLTSSLLFPMTAIVLTVVIWVMLALVGPHIVNLVPVLVIVAVAAWLLVRLGRSALR